MKKTAFDRLSGTMLLVVAGIMPVVIRRTARPMPPETIPVFFGSTIYFDTFSWWRSWFLIIPALIIILSFIGQTVTSGSRFNAKTVFTRPPVIACAVYFLFVFISFIFSRFPHTAFYGTFQRSEGILAQAAYVTVFIASLFYFRGTQYAKPLLYALVFSSLLTGAVGLSQLLQKNFYETPFASWLVLGDWNIKGTLTSKLSSGLLYNPNSFGLYTAMLAPLFLIMGFAYNEKKWIKVLFFLTGALMLTGLAGSDSAGGLVGICAAAAVLALVYICGLVRNKKKFPMKAGVATAAIVLTLLVSYFCIGPVKDGRNRAWNKLTKTPVPVDYIFKDGVLTVTDGKGEVLFTIYGDPYDDSLVIFAEDMDVPPQLYHKDEEEYSLTMHLTTDTGDETFTIIRQKEIKNAEGIIMFQNIEGIIVFQQMFLSVQDGKINILMPDGSFVDTDTPVASWGFKNKGRWGSGRGYIWSRTFPLLKKYAIIGSGPDTFVNVFPQQDVAGKLRFMVEGPYVIVDKAHNLYLQTWITTGGVSALALLFLLAFYGVTTFASLVRSQEGPPFVYGLRLGLLAAVSAFAVSSLATDSTIAPTGVFYALLGLGYAANGWQADGGQKPS